MVRVVVVEEEEEREYGPDVWKLFRHYDALYFRGALTGAGFAVQWSATSRSTTCCFGSCVYGKQGNTITLFEPVLKHRPTTDLKKALLHLMIHAIFCVKHDKNMRQHGPFFHAWMHAINSCSFEDNQRPPGGYNISTSHDVGPEESCSIQGFLWECESCGDNLVRATKLGPPSHDCCIENVGSGATCGNMLCQWHNHKINCCETYANAGMVSKAPKIPLQKENLKGRQKLLTGSLEIAKSQRNVQDSYSAKWRDNATVRRSNTEGKHLFLVGTKNEKTLISSSLKKAGKTNRPEDNKKRSTLPVDPLLSQVALLTATSKMPKSKRTEIESYSAKLQDNAIRRPNAEGKPTSLVSGKNANSLGSSISKKAGKRQRPEDIKISSFLPTDHLKKQKVKQELVGSEKRKLLSLVGCKDAILASSTSENANKRHKPDNVQKSSVLPIASQKIPKLEKDLVASQDGFTSLVDYRNAIQRRNSTSIIGKQHKPKDVQKDSALITAPPRKPSQGSLASDKHMVSYSVGCRNAKVLDSTSSKKTHEHEGIQKTITLPAAPQRKLKQPNETNSLSKAGKKHKPEDVQRTAVLPTVKQELVASKKNKLHSTEGCSNVLDCSSKKKACEQHEPDNTQRTVSPPTASQCTLKKPDGVCSSIKAAKQHKPKVIQKTAALSAGPPTRSKLKQSNLVASEKQKRGCKTSKHGSEKEFAVISLWLNYYESEGSSGSSEPLVNKRTERRKRARNLSKQITYSRSKKRDTRGRSPSEIQPLEESSCQQSQPQSLCLDNVQPSALPCLDNVLIDLDEKVVNQASGDQSESLAPFIDPGRSPSIIQPLEENSSQQSQSQSLCLDTVAIDHVQPSAPPCLDIILTDLDEEVVNQASGDRSESLAPFIDPGRSPSMIQPLEENSSQQSQPQSLCLDTVAIDHVQPSAPPCLNIIPTDLDEEVVNQASGHQSEPPAPFIDPVDANVSDQMVPTSTSQAIIDPDIIVLSDDD